MELVNNMAENEVREAQSVVTSSNAADFYAERLGLADEAPPAAEENSEPGKEAKEQSEPKAEEEAKGTEKSKDKLEKRFSKISKQRDEANTRAEQLEARLRELEAKANPQTIAQTANADDKPQASQFNDAFEYAEALAEWSAEKALKDRDIAEQQRRVEDERNKVLESWNNKVSKVQKDIPDFNKVVSKSSVVVSDAVRDAIIESDVGPQILYHLASDNDLAESISKMPAIKALKEIGRLEAKFEAEPQEKAEKKAKTVSTSKAPAPISPLKGGKSAGADVLVDTNGEFYGSYAQWKAARMANRIR
jgi:murein DD-endopeptidase MepM/ murein hydrolase activator NlpD